MCIGQNTNYKNAEHLAMLDKKAQTKTSNNLALKNKEKKTKTGEWLEIALNSKAPIFDRENATENYLKKAKRKASPEICTQLAKISPDTAIIVEEHLEVYR